MLCKNNRNVIRLNNEGFREYEMQIRVNQGCVLSPLLFSVVMDEAMRKACSSKKKLSLSSWKLRETVGY